MFCSSFRAGKFVLDVDSMYHTADICIAYHTALFKDMYTASFFI